MIIEVKDCNSGELMRMEYPKVGVCGLSCRLCPSYYIEGASRCGGCKSEIRITVGCPFITCAVKRKGIEFCWDCIDSETCDKWRGHREIGKKSDTFKCYQRLEGNIDFIEKNGVAEFEKQQKIREKLLKEMLQEFNEGRSKRYYCIAATVLEIKELEAALSEAKKESKGSGLKEKSRILHSLLDAVAARKNYLLKLRK